MEGVVGEGERAGCSDGSGGRAGEEVVGVVERTRDAADDTDQDGVLLVTIFLVVVAVGGCRVEQFGREGEAARRVTATTPTVLVMPSGSSHAADVDGG
uniref:Uncharacterized protein n=1 Tax=Oryza sativa subsp. japonica TaxID=39947 RepID=Q6F2U3_ORYSJ|nr:hypothetical protein [Oryza sativa Japonica Group]AAV25044.1 hypothetical protein [Oryza sativa Japonica Group]